jgi:hypothetical protein
VKFDEATTSSEPSSLDSTLIVTMKLIAVHHFSLLGGR